MHQYLRFTYRKVGGGHWSHFQVLFQVSGGPKMAIFMAKTRPRWRGCSRLDWPTWKVYSAPYHTPLHGRAWLRTIFAHSRLRMLDCCSFWFLPVWGQRHAPFFNHPLQCLTFNGSLGGCWETYHFDRSSIVIGAINWQKWVVSFSTQLLPPNRCLGWDN